MDKIIDGNLIPSESILKNLFYAVQNRGMNCLLKKIAHYAVQNGINPSFMSEIEDD